MTKVPMSFQDRLSMLVLKIIAKLRLGGEYQRAIESTLKPKEPSER